jgi:repressor LexA
MQKQSFSVTNRQRELLLLIYQYIKTAGYPPTFEEMRDGLRVKSNQSVLDLLEKLTKAGYLKRSESARSLTILPLGYEVIGVPALVPFLGATSAGMPIEAVSISGQWHPCPVHDDRIERLQEEMFMLRVYGDSMINAGIDDGDAVLVQTKKEFISGEVVLAQIGDSVTIKRFISQDKPPYVYLKPENPNYTNILIRDDVELKGKVISVLKSGYWKSIT